MNCLEQVAEATYEVNLLKGEYSLVTTHLTDIEEIEALPRRRGTRWGALRQGLRPWSRSASGIGERRTA